MIHTHHKFENNFLKKASPLIPHQASHPQALHPAATGLPPSHTAWRRGPRAPGHSRGDDASGQEAVAKHQVVAEDETWETGVIQEYIPSGKITLLWKIIIFYL